MPIDREKVLQAAQKHVEKKKYDAAIAEYQKIVQEDPNDARTLLKIGDLQARLQAYPEAIATYDRVGQHYANQGFSLKAIAVYKQIREIIKKHAPDLSDRYGHIGPRLAEIYGQLGLASDALAAWDEVATRLQRAGRDREAVDVFRKMVELDPGNPLPHLRLAEACCRVHALDEAVESFWTAADLLLNLSRQDDALKVIERILHFRADARYARVAAELYLAKGSREDGLLALAKLQICFQANPKDLDTLGLLGQAFTCIGQDDKAIEVYKEMARVAREQGRVDVFDGLLEHLRNVAPDDEQVRALIGGGANSMLPGSLPPSGRGPSSMAPPRPSSTAPPRPSSMAPPRPSSSIAPRRDPSSRAPRRNPSNRAPSLGPDDGIVSVEDGEVEFIEEPPSIELLDEPRPFSTRGGRSAPTRAKEGVLVDNYQEAAEELEPPDDFDGRAHAKKAIVDAESFRKLRLYPKAIETLHIALEIDPRSIEIRSKLREILDESGDRAGTIAETVNLAALHLDRGDTMAAEPLLLLVLDWDGAHEGARALYEQIAPGRLPYRGAEAGQRAYPKQSQSEAYDPFDPSAPLPSYDLEEISADQALYHERPGRSLPSDDPLAAAMNDDPFLAEPEEPLPSFPLSEGTESGRVLPLFEELDEISQVEEMPSAATSSNDTDLLEEVLDEADFFVARGLLEDARTILQEQLTRNPKHRLILERLQEIDGRLGLQHRSRTVDRSEFDSPPSSALSPSLAPLDRLEMRPSGVGGEGSSGVDADQLFESFKAGIRAEVSDGDSATHYDLGVAYKEMGLVTDAIHELELAARDPNRECMCFAMIGMVHLEQSQLDLAAESYLRALGCQVRSIEQEQNLCYDLGSVYELQGRTLDALQYFHRIARREPGYRDVQERIENLKGSRGKPSSEPSGTRTVSEDDEFERVFDDLFESQ